MRLAIVSGDDMARNQLIRFLNDDPIVESVQGFTCAEEVLERLSACTAELILVDLELTGMHGIELIRKLKQARPGMEIMAYTILEDRITVINAVKAGASGYLLKDDLPHELLNSIRILHRGESPLNPKAARKIVLELQSTPSTDSNPLTCRESVIVKCLEQGLTYKEIAGRFRISPHTVHTHIKNIYEKLQTRGRHDALRRARMIGII